MGMKHTDIKALRGFMHAGKAIAAGATLRVSESVALELAAMNKATIIVTPLPYAKNESLSTEDAQTVRDEAAASARNQQPREHRK
jgi:hypothetical protein